MPIVNIDTWPLKPEQKPVIIKDVTEVFVCGLALDCCFFSVKFSTK